MKIDAHFTKGVLKVTVPFKELPTPKNTVVVGWDLSTAAQGALKWAIRHEPHTRIVLVRVSRTDIPTDTACSPASPEAAVLTAPRNELARIRETHPQLKVDAELVSGDTVEKLARFSNDTSLLVVGTDRQEGGGFRYRWSVGAKLAATAQGPVAIIPTSQSTEGGEVVVGVDGSAASTAALAFGATEADRSGVTLHAVLAWQEPPVWIDATVPDPEYLHFLDEMHSRIFGDSLAFLSSDYPHVHVRRSLIRGPAPKVLLGAAAAASLTVVGSHGLRGIKRLLLGSVSRSVVANTPCPVVVVHAD